MAKVVIQEVMNDGLFDMPKYLIKSGSISYDISQVVKFFDGKILDYDIVFDLSHTIVTVFDSKQGKNVLGVIENMRGHICLPFDFDSITYLVIF